MRKTIVTSLLLAPALAFASGYSVPNSNPRDLSVCASAVAAQIDSGAAFADPAALGRIEGLYVKGAPGIVNVFNTWDDPTPGFTTPPPPSPATADLKLQFTPFPIVSASYGGKLPMLGNRGWGVGLGIQPFGGAIVKWPDGWAGRYRIVEVDRRAFSGIASAGIEVIPQVRIGGGVMYYYTTEKFIQKACIACLSPSFAGAPDATGTLDLSGGAVAYDASAEIDPVPNVPLRIAVDYKHKATQDLDGDVKWQNVPGPAAAAVPILRNQDVKQQLTIPNTLNVGVSYRVMKPLLVMFTFTLDRWVVYDADTFTGSEPGARLSVPRGYRNGQTYRAGAEYDLTRAVQLRAGLQRDVSGLRTSTYSPTLPDGSSWGGSLGATYRFGRGFSVDAAVFYANMDEVTSTNNSASEPPAPGDTGSFRGKYNPSALIYGIAIGWTPGVPQGG